MGCRQAHRRWTRVLYKYAVVRGVAGRKDVVCWRGRVVSLYFFEARDVLCCDARGDMGMERVKRSMLLRGMTRVIRLGGGPLELGIARGFVRFFGASEPSLGAGTV